MLRLPQDSTVDVLIVGGGPVGLFLGTLLLHDGLTVRILEQRAALSTHSRAIGIHPPALDALALADVTPHLVREGVRVTTGVARSQGKHVAQLNLGIGPSHHPFVLTIPQHRTEEILAERVQALDPDALVRGFCVSSLHDGGTSVTLTGSLSGAQPCTELRGRLVIGADGAHSTVRRLLAITTRRRNYPDTYLMGDFPDTGSDGPAAVLFLEPGGIVESFPLPDGRRRWVVHTEHLLQHPTAAQLAGLIKARTGVGVDAAANSMLSAFAVRSRLARQLVRGRVALVGDAAHEISPIGGQGMNVGWVDAAQLAPIIVAALHGEETGGRLALYERNRMRAARAADRQAWLNMALGREGPPSYLNGRNLVLSQLLRIPPVHSFIARRFTMQ